MSTLNLRIEVDTSLPFGDAMRSLRQEISCKASDAAALKNPLLIAPWHVGMVLERGQLVRFRDLLFRVTQAHTARPDWIPNHTHTHFQRVIEDSGDKYPEWTPAPPWYFAGDRVSHVGRSWESVVNNNHWEPGAPGIDDRIWQELT